VSHTGTSFHIPSQYKSGSCRHNHSWTATSTYFLLQNVPRCDRCINVIGKYNENVIKLNKYVVFTVVMTSHVIYEAMETCSLNTIAPTREVLSSYCIPTFTMKYWYCFVWDFEMMKSNVQCISADSTSVLLTADYQTLRTEACYFLL